MYHCMDCDVYESGHSTWSHLALFHPLILPRKDISHDGMVSWWLVLCITTCSGTLSSTMDAGWELTTWAFLWLTYLQWPSYAAVIFLSFLGLHLLVSLRAFLSSEVSLPALLYNKYSLLYLLWGASTGYMRWCGVHIMQCLACDSIILKYYWFVVLQLNQFLHSVWFNWKFMHAIVTDGWPKWPAETTDHFHHNYMVVTWENMIH